MTVDQTLNKLIKDCWVFESYVVQNDETLEFEYVIKLSCGVQARGRYASVESTFKKALDKVYKEVTDKWGSKPKCDFCVSPCGNDWCTTKDNK